jgi:hypothetical protein
LARDITEKHVQEHVYGIWNERRKSQANALKNAISAMFKYAIEYDNSPERYGEKSHYDIVMSPV